MSGPARTGLALVAALLVALSAAWPAGAQESADLAGLRAEALALVNQTRREHGLIALAPDARLDAAAQAHAEDMLSRGYYDHVSPEGLSLFDRYAAGRGGNWRMILENLMLCEGCPATPSAATVEGFHRRWMTSDGHREAILRRGVTEFGFGIASRDGVVYAVQSFLGARATVPGAQ